MIIELPPGNVVIDKTPYISNFKINIAKNHQLRIRFNAIKGERVIPFDIVIFRWDLILPSLGKLAQVGIKVNGKEMHSNKDIKVSISIHLVSKQFTMAGTINNLPADISGSFKSICKYFADIFLI